MFAQSIELLGAISAISNPEPKTSFSSSTAETKSNDSVPAEGWSDRSQNCVHDMYVVSNTQLIWNRQQ